MNQHIVNNEVLTGIYFRRLVVSLIIEVVEKQRECWICRCRVCLCGVDAGLVATVCSGLVTSFGNYDGEEE